MRSWPDIRDCWQKNTTRTTTQTRTRVLLTVTRGQRRWRWREWMRRGRIAAHWRSAPQVSVQWRNAFVWRSVCWSVCCTHSQKMFGEGGGGLKVLSDVPLVCQFHNFWKQKTLESCASHLGCSCPVIVSSWPWFSVIYHRSHLYYGVCASCLLQDCNLHIIIIYFWSCKTVIYNHWIIFYFSGSNPRRQ